METKKYKTKRHEALYKKYNGRCVYCSEKISDKCLGLDHFIPKSKGGKNVDDNLFPVCVPCNSRKGDRLPIEWLDQLNLDIQKATELLKKLRKNKTNLELILQRKTNGN